MTTQELSSLIKNHPDVSKGTYHHVTNMYLNEEMQFNMYWLILAMLHGGQLVKNNYTFVEKWIGTDTHPA